MNIKPDIKARITLTLKKNESNEGTITFITPEAYPHSLKVGMRIEFQEGSRIIGYAEVLEIYNDVLADR